MGAACERIPGIGTMQHVVFNFLRRKDKTTHALARTRKGWGGGLASLFQGAMLSDDRLWEGLEDALISADVGVDTSLGVVNAVRQRVREEGVDEPDEVIETVQGGAGVPARP